MDTARAEFKIDGGPAQAIGAVNTIQLQDGRRIGYNTDASGFEEGFRRGMPGAPLNSVLQVGGGGAGAATAFAFLRLGVQRLSIVARADANGDDTFTFNVTDGPAVLPA